MKVETAVEHDIDLLGPKAAESALAATALALARRIDDPRTSSTSLSMCAKALTETMERLYALDPPKQEGDDVDDLAARRDARRAAAAAASRS